VENFISVSQPAACSCVHTFGESRERGGAGSPAGECHSVAREGPTDGRSSWGGGGATPSTAAWLGCPPENSEASTPGCLAAFRRLARFKLLSCISDLWCQDTAPILCNPVRLFSLLLEYTFGSQISEMGSLSVLGPRTLCAFHALLQPKNCKLGFTMQKMAS